MYGNFHKLSNNIIKKTIYKLTFFHKTFLYSNFCHTFAIGNYLIYYYKP